ncbi:unnamed protein product, partial [Rotaria sp. Silwood2]
ETSNIGQSSSTPKTTAKLQAKGEKEEQDRQSSALASYFNKTNNNDEEDKTPWDDMKSNDWGDTLETEDDKWEDFSAASLSSQAAKTTTTTQSSSVSNSSLWVQDKPSSTSQKKNDWDSDAFFDDVLTTATKPKLKTSRH